MANHLTIVPESSEDSKQGKYQTMYRQACHIQIAENQKQKENCERSQSKKQNKTKMPYLLKKKVKNTLNFS